MFLCENAQLGEMELVVLNGLMQNARRTKMQSGVCLN